MALRNLTPTCGFWHYYWNKIIFAFIYKIWAKCKAASAVSCMGLRQGHVYSLFINGSAGCFNYKETCFQSILLKMVNIGWSGFTALAVCMKSPCVWLCLQSAAIMPCLALHSSNTRALEKLISYSTDWAGFFCQTRSQVKTIIVGQKLYNAHLIYMSFSSLLSKLTVLMTRP